MNTMQTKSFSDEQRMADLLNCEKHMTSIYNSFCCESATPTVRSCLCSLLQDEHRMQEQLFREMSARGWYPVEKAEDQKLISARMKFEKSLTV